MPLYGDRLRVRHHGRRALYLRQRLQLSEDLPLRRRVRVREHEVVGVERGRHD